MDVRFISRDGVRSCAVTELRALLDRPDGLVWVDVPTWDDQANDALTTIFGFHPLAVRDSMNRNQVPKVHRYEDHFFVVLHAPQSGAHGHVHYVELDQFIGGRSFGAGNGQDLLLDAVDQFQHLTVMAKGQKDYLQGTIEFYQARTNTKMTIAAERLAVIAAVTLPITALSSIIGMNVIVNERTQWLSVAAILLVMLAMSGALLVWAKRKGWF